MPLQVSYQDSFGLDTPVQANWGTGTGLFPAITLNVKQFDSSIGELQSVHIDLHSSATGSLKFESRDSTAETVAGSIGATIVLERPADKTTLLTGTVAANTSDLVSKYDGLTDFSGTSGRTYANLSASGDRTLDLNSESPDFSMFVGTGTLAFPTSAVGASGITGAASIASALRTFAEADITVTYTYHPLLVSVPEPGSMGLLLVGLLCFRRPGKNSSKAC